MTKPISSINFNTTRNESYDFRYHDVRMHLRLITAHRTGETHFYSNQALYNCKPYVQAGNHTEEVIRISSPFSSWNPLSQNPQ